MLPALALGLYGLNRLFLRQAPGEIGLFCRCSLNDLICPLFVIPAAQIILGGIGIKVRKYRPLFVFTLFCGIIWEFVIPVWKKDSVYDPWDLLFYFAGMHIYYFLMKHRFPEKRSRISRKDPDDGLQEEH